MNDKKWLELFDNTKDKFKWFFIEYGYESVWDELNILRGQESQLKMISLMNRVWYQLPDNKFNIMENPAGWNEFLALIENE